MDKPKMNTNQFGEKVLCDIEYGKIGICKGCGCRANLDKGYCESCFK